jgi:hypothetical protein
MDDAATRAARAETWFTEHGLPWFVDAEDARIEKLLRARRVVPVVVTGVVLSVLVGVAVFLARWAAGDLPAAVGSGVVVGAWTWGLLAVLYGLTVLRVGATVRWANRRAVGDLWLLVPLVTRALPLLLLFTTFLFINTEVWQVASALERSALWGIVLLFGAVAVVFLLAALPQEVAKVVAQVRDGGVQKACEGTGLEDDARELAEAGRTPEPTLSGRQRANLLLVLLIAQSVQVLMLAVAVFGFFVLFGLVAIGDDVVQEWLGHPPTERVWSLGGAVLTLPVGNELFQVAVFLAAFSGLYFTVYAVSDATYREQFFTHVSRDLEQAVGVRAVYQARPGD